jgi:Aspartyl protease
VEPRFKSATLCSGTKPIAEATFTLANQEQVRASVVLDTGAGYYSAVFGPAFDARNHLLSRIGTFARRPDRAKGTGGEVELLAARLNRIELGPTRLNGPIVGVIRTASAGFPWDGLLGAGFFRRFVATFDFSRQQLWLEPQCHPR